ncbi:hypothetical protein BSKO_00659 [Bryopsis sp. KO-2023]|nr:hypothetical protein BSKO_00659 [Bryopsis sp. KO-2023]
MECFLRAGPTDFAGSTLVVPAVSIGNVGQVCTEVILGTFGFPLVGYLNDENVLPCVGRDPFGDDESKLALSLEIYGAPSRQLYFIQQRAPVVPGRQREFANRLIAWAKEQGFGRVVVVGSLDAFRRKDAQINDRQLRFVATSEELAPWLSSAGLKELEDSVLFDDEEKDRRVSPWPLITRCRTEGLAACSVLAFVSEGDNLQEGVEMASLLNTLLDLGLDKSGVGKWRIPPTLMSAVRA